MHTDRTTKSIEPRVRSENRNYRRRRTSEAPRKVDEGHSGAQRFAWRGRHSPTAVAARAAIPAATHGAGGAAVVVHN